jgi:hypothetical protein
MFCLLCKCLFATTTFIIYMSIGVHDIFVLVVNFINVNWQPKQMTSSSLLLNNKLQASRNKLMNKKLSYISCMYYYNYVNILISHMHAIELKMTIIVCLVNQFFFVSYFSSNYGPTSLIELCSMCLYDNLFNILLKTNGIFWNESYE